MQLDWWRVLGVPRDADEVVVRRAYRRLAMDAHPDRGGTTERMQALNAAWEAAQEALAAREEERRLIANPFRQYAPKRQPPARRTTGPMSEKRAREAEREAAGYHGEAVIRVEHYEPDEEERWRGVVISFLG